MTSYAKLSGLLYIKLKIAIQAPKMYLFRVLSMTTVAFEANLWPSSETHV